MKARVPVLVALLVGGALPGIAVAEDARLPKPRPAIASLVTEASVAAVAPADAAQAIAVLAPLPRPRPDAPPLLALVAPREAVTPPQGAGPSLSIEGAAEHAACLKRLDALGVVYREIAPIVGEGGCGIARPVEVSSLGSGVAIRPETVVNCAEALALATWIKDSVTPNARRLLGEAPSKLVHDSAYVCRNRYNNPGAKISEHARGAAVDVAAFEFEGRKELGIGRSQAGSAAARFEAAIRADSCRIFTTVLGPGSNAAHATHFHLDLAQRRGGYRLCELDDPRTARALEKTKRE